MPAGPGLSRAPACSLLLLTLAATGCGGSGNLPTSPPGLMANYEGQWSGTTSQGMRISFTITDQRVTSIGIGYNFNGCFGMNTFSGLSLVIGSPPNPGTPNPGPGFGFGSGAPDGPNYTQIYGTFSSGTSASGSMIFGDYAGCGNSLGIWSATKK